MKLHTLIGLAAAYALFGACSKGSITTKPKISFKSMSSDFLPINAGLTVTLEFSDKEGDLSNPLHVIKFSSSFCADAGFADSARWTFPDIPGTKNTDGVLEIFFDATGGIGRFNCDGLDTVETAIFKFVIVDDAGNVSDTASTPPITIEK